MEIFAWIEGTAVSVWVRESPSVWAFPFVLILHTVGLAFVGGAAVAVNAFAMTWPRKWNPADFEPWFQFAWSGFAVNLISGILLLAAYPAKALTNPVFFVKLACVIAAMIQLQWLRTRTVSLDPRQAGVSLKRTAVLAFALWGIGIVTGRFLAYTHNYLMSSDMAAGLG